MQPHIENGCSTDPLDGAALGEHPFDRELARHLGFDDMPVQAAEPVPMSWAGIILIISLAFAALAAFILLDPQHRIHLALASQLYGSRL